MMSWYLNLRIIGIELDVNFQLAQIGIGFTKDLFFREQEINKVPKNVVLVLISAYHRKDSNYLIRGLLFFQ